MVNPFPQAARLYSEHNCLLRLAPEVLPGLVSGVDAVRRLLANEAKTTTC